jgi:hypothetical protein
MGLGRARGCLSTYVNLDLVAIVHEISLQRKTGKWSNRGMRLLLAEATRCHHEAGEGFVVGMTPDYLLSPPTQPQRLVRHRGLAAV